MRVVIDTNVVVSRVLSRAGPPSQIFGYWVRQAFELVVSEPILAEHQRALLYQHVAERHHMSAEGVSALIEEMRQFAVVVAPPNTPSVIPEDPADDKFLACATEGAADFIVSGDAHLLQLREYRGIQILSPRAFLALLQASDTSPPPLGPSDEGPSS